MAYFAYNVTASVSSLIFFGLLSLAAILIAYYKNYFKLEPEEDKPPLIFFHVFIAFAIYIGVSIIVSYVVQILPDFNTSSLMRRVKLIGVMNIFNLGGAALLFYFFFFRLIPRVGHYIWKRGDSSYKFDVLIGAISWLIAFPVVVFTNELLEYFIHAVFKPEQIPDQVAIQYVKLAMKSPFIFTLAIISIVILAPFVEEFLFRGVIQSWLKKFLGTKSAILVASLIFSLFHFSMVQSLSNITIIGSLFVLALFLGFIYERQKSLIASISLHATFNGLSILNLFYSSSSSFWFSRFFGEM